MEEININELNDVAGAGIIGDIIYGIGYGAGYAGGYFYSHVMTSNRWLDDVAEFVLP